MKFIRVFLVALFFVPAALHAASNEFMVAAQLLAAAKNADIQQVQILINNGADVNFVDSTGLSIVCTALMNNDVRAAQILQMYGADASKCDRQIKQYNNRTKPKESGGLFGGLSSAQSITLTAAGAAVIVAGLYFLTDWLDPGNDNDTVSSGGSHSGGNSGGGGSTNTGTVAFALPYGPATLVADYNYDDALNFYSTDSTETPIYYNNYGLMTNTYKQNYLLMMHGYSPLARGYMGMQTLRNLSTNAPLNISGNNLGTDSVMGGRPINVTLVTTNGINAEDDTSLQNKFLLWAELNNDGTGTGGASNANVSSKYYNNTIIRGGDNETLGDDSVNEDSTLVNNFDLSGHGTAIGNTGATADDNLIAKVVGGSDSGYSSADFMGFMPNGQLTIFRTGGGTGASGVIDYYNYKALSLAAVLPASSPLSPDIALEGRSAPTVLANTSVIAPLHAKSVEDLDYMVSYIASATSTATKQEFSNLIDKYYDLNTTDGTSGTDALPSSDAVSFFSKLGSQYYPITIFSTGANEISVSEYTGRVGKTYLATFENAVPMIYENSEHLFMSVVGVSLDGNGTSGQSTISAFTPSGKYTVTQWQNTNGTTDDTSDDTYYRARVCGVAGTGTSSVDPWCFAAAGVTDELAVASAAGAVGILQSAFSYLNVKQLYALLALTADGAYLGTADNGTVYNETTLTNYLQSMYALPSEYQFRVNNGEKYLDVFKEVFGYGLINLERATTPTKKIYYYAGSGSNPDIVSGSGNAYWRAASNTAFRSSSALPMRAATLTTSAYDVLESIDGSMSLPRIWESSFAIGNTGRHGLYMGDVLGELKTRRDTVENMKIGNMSFHLARSERAYNDNMNGLDELRLGFDMGAWHMSADYQHHLTDGVSRFSGMSNPVLSLASNAVTTNVRYGFGNWKFGARAFSGSITDDGLLENDPTISAQYMPATLGFMNGAESSMGWGDDTFGITASFGFMHESNTVLGAQTDGLLGLGAGDTQYVDAELRYSPIENVMLRARGTYARTNTGADGLFITDVSNIESDAFAFGADVGNFSFTIARPLSAYRGAMKYAYANYAVVDNGDGTYGIDVSNVGIENIRFGSDKRELRFSGEYRYNFGKFTDGALGFIYRVNPNNTDEFGNESIFMLKLSHRVGI